MRISRANTWTITPSTRTLAQYYTYGASIGRAIVKDKLFFFVNGEYEDNIVAGPSRLARENADQEYGGDSPTTGPWLRIWTPCATT
ncbi:MAG: hypothetical protein ACLS37_08270 [Alistipes sp.]